MRGTARTWLKGLRIATGRIGMVGEVCCFWRWWTRRGVGSVTSLCVYGGRLLAARARTGVSGHKKSDRHHARETHV